VQYFTLSKDGVRSCAVACGSAKMLEGLWMKNKRGRSMVQMLLVRGFYVSKVSR
jgi:hypothetical protein